ncbi:unannotated protein [freshwater metagenome]|uniref:Unannotated protein n=1 Tax=freshwater metagenome TaxID=449393 RepID=A0A6J6TZY4_9ZZZZ
MLDRIATMLVLLPALALAGCGSDEADQVLSDTEHSQQDVAFATDMVQHHAQALSMVDLTRGRPLDPEVAALAEEVRDAQAPEIELMTDWLVDWDEDVPATMRDHSNAGHGDHSAADAMEGMEGTGGSDMPGMLTAEQLRGLEEAGDAEFEDLWLELMIAHHEGAVAMAEEQAAEGTYRPAVELAEDVVAGQTAEIERMRALLG